MFKYYLIPAFLLIVCTLSAQLSSDDIRHAGGKGPYPIYVNFQAGYASMKNNFGNFSKHYATDVLGLENGQQHFWGFEGNIGFVINEDNFLWIPNFRVYRVSVELGYRHLIRNLGNTERNLHLQEEVLSLRVGFRGNILYPLTYQLQTGPTFHNVSMAREYNFDKETTKRLRQGDSLFENARPNKFPAGWDFRARLMFLDPAGTDGGIGFFFEYRYLLTFGDVAGGKRDLEPYYKTFIDADEAVNDIKSWNYGSFTVGIIAPLAVRIR